MNPHLVLACASLAVSITVLVLAVISTRRTVRMTEAAARRAEQAAQRARATADAAAVRRELKRMGRLI